MTKHQVSKQDTRHLDEISRLIRVDTELAWHEALAALKKHQSKKRTYAYAKSQLLVYVIGRLIKDPMANQIDEMALLDYFEKNEHTEDASWLMLTIINVWTGKPGYHEKAMALDEKYEREYAETAPFEHRVQRMISGGYVNMMRNLDKTDQMAMALKAEAMLRSGFQDTAWYRTSLSQVLQLKAEALSHTADVDQVRSAINESVELVDRPGISLQYIFTAYYFKGNVAAVADRTNEALEVYQSLETRFEGQSFYNALIILFYLQIFKQLNVKSSADGLSETEKNELIASQLKYIEKANSVMGENPRPYMVAYLALSEGRLMRVTGEYQKAITLLAKALKIFTRNRITNHIIDIYEEAYHTYQQWAERDRNYILYRKAMRVLKYAHDLTYKYNQTEGKEKMDALINQYELRQKELNEKLLHQKMEAMNKEIQMTALTLHEKVMVLDELKDYVTSLRKKGQETNQLINAISKKIDAVIITEQDKTSLQQKIDKGNKDFYRTMSERYPALSVLELHMCGLLKTGMTNKELSKLYGQSEKSYEQHRYRIKKKLSLTAKDNLVRFLASIA